VTIPAGQGVSRSCHCDCAKSLNASLDSIASMVACPFYPRTCERCSLGPGADQQQQEPLLMMTNLPDGHRRTHILSKHRLSLQSHTWTRQCCSSQQPHHAAVAGSLRPRWIGMRKLRFTCLTILGALTGLNTTQAFEAWLPRCSQCP
jgi:hypothetical protein